LLQIREPSLAAAGEKRRSNRSSSSGTWRRKPLIYAMQHCGCWTNDFLIRLHWQTLNFHWGAPLVFRSNPTRIVRVCICVAWIAGFVFDMAESFIHNQGEARQLLSDKKHAARSDKARRRTEHTMSGTAWCFESYRAQLGPCSVHYAQCHYFQVMSNIFQVKNSWPA